MVTLVIMSLFPYILSLLIIVLSFLLFNILQKPNANLPPGSSGWPVVGESINFVLSGPQEFVEKRRKMYSQDTFRTSLFGKKMCVFCGPLANKFIFSSDANLLTTWWPLSVRKALYFPEFVEASTDEISAIMLSFIHNILKPEALKQYIPVMDSMAQEHVELNWVGNEVLKVFPASKKYTFDLACRLFMGIDAEHVTSLAKYFSLIITGLFSVPIDLPGTAYNRALKGGKLMREEIMKIISDRKKEMLDKKLEIASKSDFLSRMLLLLTDANNESISDKVICNNIVGLLFASYETTSTGVSFVLKYLAQLPHIYDEVHREQMEIAKSKSEGELLKWEDIQKMKYSWNVVCETLRLVPPALGGFREVASDFTFAGFTIPKGWKTFWMVHTTNKNPKYFPDPEKFDPSRFEGNGPAPYTFVPFGGGSRMCPGKEYGRLQILVFLHNVVTKFKLEITNPREKIVFHSFPVPAEGLPLRIIRHKT